MRRDIVIVGCGNQKRDTPSPAADLYTGGYSRAAIAWARSVGARVLILSAKHGLIDGSEIISPYNASWSKRHPGKERAATVASITPQLHAFGIIDGEVAVLAGRDYLLRIYAASNRAVRPRNIFAELAKRTHGNSRVGYQKNVIKQSTGIWPTEKADRK